MKISAHYPAYEEKAYIVITNNQLARIFLANDRDFEELITIKAVKKNEIEDEYEANEDAQKETRKHFYKKLIKYLEKNNAEFSKLILCAPEALKNELHEQLPQSLQEKCTEVIPKNLASLPEDQIIRILQEKK